MQPVTKGLELVAEVYGYFSGVGIVHEWGDLWVRK
jgi:hypothetical protein